MLMVKNWRPKNDDEKPDWEKYKYHESAKLEDICCLALNKSPPHILMLNRPNGDQYQYFGYRILGNDREFSVFEELVDYVIGSHFIDKYNRFYRRVAEQLGLGESLPPLPLIKSLDYSVDSIRYETKVKRMIYDKALKENWWGLKGDLEVSNEAITLANHIHSKAFIYEHVRLSNDIRENLVENGGTLFFLEGTRRLMFSDFAEWADSKGIDLPEGFPRPPAYEMPDLFGDLEGDGITWVDRLEGEEEPKEPEPLSGHQVKGKGRFERQCVALVEVLRSLGCEPKDVESLAKIKTTAFDTCRGRHRDLFSIERSTFDSIWVRAKAKGILGKKKKA